MTVQKTRTIDELLPCTRTRANYTRKENELRLIDGDSVIDRVLKSDKKNYTKSELLKMLGEQKVIIDTDQEKLEVEDINAEERVADYDKTLEFLKGLNVL